MAWDPKHARKGVDLYIPFGYLITITSETPEISAYSPMDSPKRIVDFLHDSKRNISSMIL